MRQLGRDGQHVERVHRHPARAVGLLEVAARRQRRAAIEHADVVEAQEAALEDVHAFGILAVHPPGEVQQQLLEDALEERAIADRRDVSFRSCRRASAAHAWTGGFTSPNAHS